MAITIENATVTATVDCVRYVNVFVTNIEINDPRENSLTVSPQGGGQGIAYRTNTTSAVETGLTVRDLAIALTDLYKGAFADQTRVDFMIVNTASGERYDLNNSIVRSNPTNSTISEGDTALDVAINISTPPASFQHVTATT
jgi:hypothetical protein